MDKIQDKFFGVPDICRKVLFAERSTCRVDGPQKVSLLKLRNRTIHNVYRIFDTIGRVFLEAKKIVHVCPTRLLFTLKVHKRQAMESSHSCKYESFERTCLKLNYRR